MKSSRFLTGCIVRHRFSGLLAAAVLAQCVPAAHAAERIERCPKPAAAARVTLRYDGSTYRVAKGLAPWWLIQSSWEGR